MGILSIQSRPCACAAPRASTSPRPIGEREGPIRRSAAKLDGRVRGLRSHMEVCSFGLSVAWMVYRKPLRFAKTSTFQNCNTRKPIASSAQMVSMWKPRWHSRIESRLKDRGPLTLPSFAWVPPSPRWGEVKNWRDAPGEGPFPRHKIHTLGSLRLSRIKLLAPAKGAVIRFEDSPREIP